MSRNLRRFGSLLFHSCSERLVAVLLVAVPVISSENSRTHFGIELLRGIAALMVVVAHYTPYVTKEISLVNFAFTGVDLFFVLSGFVFAPYFFSTQPQWVPHLIRRAFRIYPLYLVALFCYVSLKIWLGGEIKYVFDHLTMTYTLTSREEAFYYNPAFWSLPPEIEFYLLLPLLSRLSRKVLGFRVLLVGSLLMRGVICWNLPADMSIDAWFIASVHLPGLLSQFLLGVMAYRLALAASRQAWVWAAYAIVGVVLIGLFGTYVTRLIAHGGQELLTANRLTRGTVGLIAAFGYAGIVVGLGSWIQSCPSFRFPAQLLGRLSYGLYLFHNAAPPLLIHTLGLDGLPLTLLSLLLTLMLVGVLHRLVENPAINFGRSLARRFV